MTNRFNCFSCWLNFGLFSVQHINENKPRIIEGEIRSKALSNYLEVLNLEKYVWLSEDGSGIVEKVEFDPNTNQMVGLVLPIDPLTGNPIPFTYLARDADEIRSNMQKSTSAYVYIVMAQPLANNAPPFILQIFGTDNKFKTQNVLYRWKYTIEELGR